MKTNRVKRSATVNGLPCKHLFNVLADAVSELPKTMELVIEFLLKSPLISAF